MLRPHLDDEEVEPIRALCLQNLRSLEDDPGTKVIYELRQRHFPDPWGRPSPGTPEGVAALTPDALRIVLPAGLPAQRRDPGRGRRDRLAAPPATPSAASSATGSPGPSRAVQEQPTGPSRDHILRETQQIQIALAYPAATVASPDYYRARAATAILGGYSSARLFTEVREKRGLCYSVYASYESQRDRAAVLCYAGTSDRPGRSRPSTSPSPRSAAWAARGSRREELETMRAGLKSSLIMAQESSMSRSSSLASDWFYLGRVRSLDEISAALDALTPESVSDYAAGFKDLARPDHPDARADRPAVPGRGLSRSSAGSTPRELGPSRVNPSIDSPMGRSTPMHFHHTILDNGLQVIAELNDQRLFGRRRVLRQDRQPRRVDRSWRGSRTSSSTWSSRGPRARDALAVNRDFDRVGAKHNAQTSEEDTFYHVTCLPEYLPQAFDVLADILRPTLREDDFETEKKVIIEEIRMYLDNPMSVAYEAAKAGPLRRPPAGQQHPGHGRVDHRAEGRPDARLLRPPVQPGQHRARLRRQGETGTRLVDLAARHCGGLARGRSRPAGRAAAGHGLVPGDPPRRRTSSRRSSASPTPRRWRATTATPPTCWRPSSATTPARASTGP